MDTAIITVRVPKHTSLRNEFEKNKYRNKPNNIITKSGQTDKCKNYTQQTENTHLFPTQGNH